jgi:hypothetical protein
MALKTKFETKTYEITVNMDDTLEVQITQVTKTCPATYKVRVGSLESDVPSYMVPYEVVRLTTKQTSARRITNKDYIQWCRVWDGRVGMIRISHLFRIKKSKDWTGLEEYTAYEKTDDEGIKYGEPGNSITDALGAMLSNFV